MRAPLAPSGRAPATACTRLPPAGRQCTGSRTMQERIRRRVLVSGRVQGVAFRASTRSQARAGAVAGWVRNLADGRVEAVFEGDAAAVAALVAWCREGPRFARV